MKYFKEFVSNTLAGSSSQSYFKAEENEINTGRVFYRIFKGGTFDYSLLFTNITDSTFADGSHSYRNMILDEWEIISASVCITKNAEAEIEGEFKKLTFEGKTTKTVMPGEFFSSDPIKLSAEKGDYLCLEIVFKGRMIPCHWEIVVPTYRMVDGKWESAKEIPVPSMIGIRRSPKLKIGFWGDSITQGVGTELNSYTHWNAVLADMLGDDYSYWNIGLGYGRADDAATGGAWFFKAKQMDKVSVCFGVNDILRGFSAEKIKENLQTIVNKLHAEGKKVLVQTVPPFDMDQEQEEIRLNVNKFILAELDADEVFNNDPILADGSRAIYEGHPDKTGCKKWAEALCHTFKEFISGK